MRQILSWRFGVVVTVATIGLAAIGAWWLTRPTAPKDPLEALKARGTIAIGVRADAPPFSALDSRKDFVGYEPEIGRALATALGVQAKFLATDARESAKLLQTGAIDIAILPRNGLGASGLGSIQPGYFASGLNAVALATRPLGTWDDLKGERICGLEHAVPASNTIRELGGEFVGFPDIATGLQALAAERCRAFVGDEVLLAAATAGDPDHQFSMSLDAIDLLPWTISLRAGDAALGDAIAAQLAAWHGSGFFIARAQAWRLPESLYLEEMRRYYAR